jgi:hypothetical protein
LGLDIKLESIKCRRHVAQFVDNQQFDCVEVLLQRPQATFVARFMNSWALVKAALWPLWQAASSNARAAWVFARPRRAECNAGRRAELCGVRRRWVA